MVYQRRIEQIAKSIVSSLQAKYSEDLMAKTGVTMDMLDRNHDSLNFHQLDAGHISDLDCQESILYREKARELLRIEEHRDMRLGDYLNIAIGIIRKLD